MIAAIGTSTAPERIPPSETTTVTGTWAVVWREWLDGLRLVRDHRVLRIVFGVFAIASLGEGVMQTAFWVYIDQALGVAHGRPAGC